jgi:hypothetical protein
MLTILLEGQPLDECRQGQLPGFLTVVVELAELLKTPGNRSAGHGSTEILRWRASAGMPDVVPPWGTRSRPAGHPRRGDVDIRQLAAHSPLWRTMLRAPATLSGPQDNGEAPGPRPPDRARTAPAVRTGKIRSMTTRRPGPGRRDPLEATIEVALQPGRFIASRASFDFVSSLEEIAGQLDALLRTDAGRAVALYETFLAGGYEKAEELDDSGGNFSMFVVSLYCGWVRARQAASADADETASLLLGRMETDPYGFTSNPGARCREGDEHGRARCLRATREGPLRGDGCRRGGVRTRVPTRPRVGAPPLG